MVDGPGGTDQNPEKVSTRGSAKHVVIQCINCKFNSVPSLDTSI